MKFLSFQIEDSVYGVPLSQVREVIAFSDFTLIPEAPPTFLGIMNLRDQIIPLFDLRIKFKVVPTLTHDTSIIICDGGSANVGIVVDLINTVVTAEPHELMGVPTALGAQENENLTMVNQIVRLKDSLVLVLNVSSIVQQGNIDIKSLVAASTAAKAA